MQIPTSETQEDVASPQHSLAYISPTHSLWNIPRRDGPKVFPKPKVQKFTRKTKKKRCPSKEN